MGSGIFGLGTRAMSAAQINLDTVSHNISNVNTPGYSRQTVELATENGLFTGAGFFGRGVKVNTISRQTNEFLIKENNMNQAMAAADQSRLDKLNQLEKVLPTGETGLGYAASQLLNAFVDVANQPQDMSARQVVISRAKEWVSRVNTAADQLNQLQLGVIGDLDTTVSRINSLTKQIAAANQAVASFSGIGHTPNDLLDQRDQLVKDLNSLVQVTTIEADDGSLNVFMGGGQLLVLSNKAETLSTVRDPLDSTKGRVALRTNGSDRVLDSDQMLGGALKGLLSFQDVDLVQTRSNLDTFVKNVADAINKQQALGVDMEGNPQTTFDASGAPVQIPFFLNTGSASTISLALTQPKGIAAASPLTASIAPANKGTLSIESLEMNRALPGTNALDFGSSLPTAGQPLTVIFEQPNPLDPTLTYRFVDQNGLPYKDVTPARVWSAGSPINDADAGSTPPEALFNINVTGVPRPGDRITVAITQNPSANNGNARAMLKLRDQTIVSLDGTTRATVTDAYSQMIGNLGVLVQDGKTSASISATLAQTSQQTLSSATGVNLDEEAAKLIQYQQSYQAAAKVLQIAQSLFDTLLQTARG
jgi:flagellar hook-associated protein 1 FlgK